MIDEDIRLLKKQIIYRCSYTGTKETDLLYKKIIINKINELDFELLKKLSSLLIELSDLQIYLILTKKQKPSSKYKSLFIKLMK